MSSRPIVIALMSFVALCSGCVVAPLPGAWSLDPSRLFDRSEPAEPTVAPRVPGSGPVASGGRDNRDWKGTVPLSNPAQPPIIVEPLRPAAPPAQLTNPVSGAARHGQENVQLETERLQRGSAEIEREMLSLQREIQASGSDLSLLLGQQLQALLEHQRALPQASGSNAVVPLRPASRIENSSRPEIERAPDSPSRNQAAAPLVTHGSGSSEARSPPATTATADPAPDSIRDDTPEPKWRTRIQQALDGIERELASGAGEMTSVERNRLEVHARILNVVLERREPALKEISRMPEEQREYWKHQLRTLLLLLDENGTPSENRRATLALRELREAMSELAAQSALDVHNLAFCSRVDGFGTLTEYPKAEFSPGQEVLLYVEIDHFSSEPTTGSSQKNGQYETELRGVYQIIDSSGRRVADAELPLDKQSCRRQRRDYFIAYHVYLPKEIPAGSYTLNLTMEDLKGKRFGQGSIEFSVKSTGDLTGAVNRR